MNKLELLKDLSHSFVTRERTNGDSFVCLKDDTDQVYIDLIRDLCDSSISNIDFAYRQAEIIIDKLIEAFSYNQCSDLEDLEFDLEPDIYNYELLGWLHSNLEAVDQVLADHGGEIGIIRSIQYAQNEVIMGYNHQIIEFINNNSDDE